MGSVQGVYSAFSKMRNTNPCSWEARELVPALAALCRGTPSHRLRGLKERTLSPHGFRGPGVQALAQRLHLLLKVSRGQWSSQGLTGEGSASELPRLGG